jgi:diguanylate cyclase (GGDEF)-like protein/putative nucleotidyltransferase with HDIG domain
MEAQRATDCTPWKEGIDPRAFNKVAGAIGELAEFPVLDATVMRILRLCDDIETTAADLVGALEQDPTFAANLLRYCNSAAAAHPVRAKTVRQAVMLVGRRALKRLAMEAATFRFLERARGNGRSSFGQMHLHAITVATGSVAAAEEAQVPADLAHLAGLLHDVGKLVLPEAFGEEACDMIARRFPSGGDRVIAERETFGIDHAQCGGLLAEAWGMDPEVVRLIAWHHGGPTGISVPTTEIACVQVADCVAAMLQGTEPDHALLEVALGRLNLSVDVLDLLADRIVHADQRTAAGRLSERVAELERLTQTDEVTGLANRRHWLQTARGMIHASASGAIVLVDVDNFRQINERFGSAAADTVLHTIGAIVSKHGHAGRLGSDAFALLAPGDLNTAAEVANRIVAQIQEAFEAGSGPKVDVSIGCSAAPQHGIELPEILEAADMALVDAKRAGRSRTSVAGNEFSSSDQFAA